MLFSTASNNSAVRTSGLVVVNSVFFEESTRSIVAYCADNTRRLCRIDNCETIDLARVLYRDIKALVGKSAFFHAAGGNDPRKWFFAVEGAPVYDDAPDTVFGMAVKEPDTIGDLIRDKLAAEAYQDKEYQEAEAAYYKDVAEEEAYVEEQRKFQRQHDESVVTNAMAEVVVLQATFESMKGAAMVSASSWHELGMDMIEQMSILQAQEIYSLSDMISDDVNEIIKIHASYAV